jgi:hypothetical protein
MRTFYCILLLALAVLAACDPPQGLYDTGTVAITARVLNPRPVIRLGDSVAFYFEVPDSVTLNGARVRVSASSKDGGVLELSASKITTAKSAGFEPFTKSCSFYANPGSSTSDGILTFANRNGRLVGRLYMIPKQKGIYFLMQTGLGYFDLNDKSLLVRGTINFGKVDRSHQLLIDSAGAASHFSTYLTGRVNQGYEVYGFRVI